MIGTEMSGAPSPVRSPGGQLLGRERERVALDRLLEAARGGHGGALVVHGEPGVGKTALLEYAGEAGGGVRGGRAGGGGGGVGAPYPPPPPPCPPTPDRSARLPGSPREGPGVPLRVRSAQRPQPVLV